MTQPLCQLYRYIDCLLTEASQGLCTDDELGTINRFWDMVDLNPQLLSEMRKTHGALLERAVNGAMWEAQLQEKKEWVKTFVSTLRINLKSPVYTGDPLLNEYIQLRAQLIHSTFFKAVVCAELKIAKPPYTPYESLLANLWGLHCPPPADGENGTVMQNLQTAKKLLQRFIQQIHQPDNIV